MYEVLLKDLSKSNSLQDTMTLNAFNLVKNLNPKFVITPTSSGATARRMSRKIKLTPRYYDTKRL